ncbi:hypothetical protein THRCLA_01485, partial [Thraustotheca clavata]
MATTLDGVSSLTRVSPTGGFEASDLHALAISFSHISSSRNQEYIFNVTVGSEGRQRRHYIGKTYGELREFRRDLIKVLRTPGICTCRNDRCTFANLAVTHLQNHPLTSFAVFGYYLTGTLMQRQTNVNAFLDDLVMGLHTVDPIAWRNECVFLQMIATFFDTARENAGRNKMGRRPNLQMNLKGWHKDRMMNYGIGISVCLNVISNHQFVMLRSSVRRCFWSNAKDVLSTGKKTMDVLNRSEEIGEKVAALSNVQLNLTQFMPVILRQRVSSLLKERTHVQLEKLKETITLSKQAKRFPFDSHNQQIGWEMSKTQTIPPFLYGPQETLAYMAHEMDGVYSSLHNVFRQMNQPPIHFNQDQDTQIEEYKPKSMLDYGSGPGTAAWVANQFYQDSLNEYRIIEPSQSMVDAAQVILEGFKGLSFRKNLAEMKRDIEKGKTYDLITLSFVLSDITNDLERIAIVSTLWSLLAENGRLIIVDRGNSWGSLQVRSARQFILDSLTTNQDQVIASDDAIPHIQGGKILGPCPHHKECPMKEGEWCHFVQRTPQVSQPRLPTPQRWTGHHSMKFSYVTFEKKASHSSLTTTSSHARLTRGPLMSTRQVTLDLCHPNGNTERRAVTKGRSIREAYRAARKAHWGGQWPTEKSTYELPKIAYPPKVRKPRRNKHLEIDHMENRRRSFVVRAPSSASPVHKEEEEQELAESLRLLQQRKKRVEESSWLQYIFLGGILCFLMIMVQLYSQVTSMAAFVQPDRKMQPMHVHVAVDLKTLYVGGVHEIQIEKQVVCSICHGHGYDQAAGMKKCPVCGGSGMVVHEQRFGNRVHRIRQGCEHCGHSGHVPNKICPVCHGRGHHNMKTNVALTITPGMAFGEQIVLAGEGNAQRHIATGDVIVHLVPSYANSRFIRRGNDLEITISISLLEALTGVSKQLGHLSGKQILIETNDIVQPSRNFIAFFNSGSFLATILHIQNQGMPLHEDPSKHGDLLVHFHIEFPKSLSTFQLQKLEKLLPNP